MNKYLNSRGMCILSAWLCITSWMMPSALSAQDNSPLMTQPDEAFVEYVQKYATPLSTEEAWGLVQEGHLVLQSISAHDSEGLQLQADSARLRQANAVVWYLMWQASNAGTAFTQGAFDLPDPEGEYWKFFSSNPASYTCSNWHYKGRALDTERGIDLLDGGEILPGNKRSILFNKISAIDGTERLFLRPEANLVPIKNRAKFLNCTKNFVQDTWSCAKGWFAKSDAPKLLRRDELPSETNMKQFKYTVSKLSLKRSMRRHAIQQAEKYGYAGMMHFLTKEYPEIVKNSGNSEKEQAVVDEFVLKIAGSFDDLTYRSGYEVLVQPVWAVEAPRCAKPAQPVEKEKSIAEEITEAVSDAEEKTAEAVDAVKEDAAAAKKAAEEKLRAAKKAAKEKAHATKKAIKDSVASAQKVGEENLDSAKKAIEETASSLKETIVEKITSAKEIAEEKVTAAQARIAEEQAKLANEKAAEKNAAAEKARAAEEKATNAKNTAEDNVDAARARFAEEKAAAERARAVEQQARTAKEIAEENAAAARVRAAKEQILAAKETVKESIAAAGVKIAEEQAVDAQVNAAEKQAAAQQAEVAEEQAAAARARGVRAREAGRNKANTLRKSVSASFKDAFDEAKDSTKKAVEDGKDSAKKEVNRARKDASKAIDPKASFKDAFDEAKDSTKKAVDDARENAAKKIAPRASFRDAYEEAKDSTKKAVEDAKDSAKEKADSAKKAVDRAREDAAKKIAPKR